MSKGSRRLKVINSIISTLKSPEIYNTIDYRNQKEDKIKQFIYRPLLNNIAKLYEEITGVKANTAMKKAKKSLLWEGNITTTVSNMTFFGVYHRPDLVVNFFNDMSIAIEIKRGKKGSSIRESIGQSIVYSTLYDFVISLFIDISKDKCILNASTSDKERQFIDTMWNNRNIKFMVV